MWNNKQIVEIINIFGKEKTEKNAEEIKWYNNFNYNIKWQFKVSSV